MSDHSTTQRRQSLPVGPLVALFLLLSVVPLALVAQASLEATSDALTKETRRFVRATAVANDSSIRSAINGAGGSLLPWSRRSPVVNALADGLLSPQERRVVSVNLRQLGTSANGNKAFVTDRRGRLIAARPFTAAAQGTDLSSEQWYRRTRAAGRMFVSDAYASPVVGGKRVVAIAAPIRGTSRRLLGFVVVAYQVEGFQAFVELLARSQNVALTLTDRRGTVLANSDAPPRKGALRTRDPLVVAALSGHAGMRKGKLDGSDRLVAFEPVDGLGWALTAAVPTKTAFEAIGDVRSTIFERLALLAVILLLGLAVLVRTLRAQRRAEQDVRRASNEAERANRAKSEFLSRMSHELRTPMNAVLGFAQLLELGELDRDQRENTRQILTAGDHLLELINEVLDVSRIEAGKLSLSLEPVNAREVVSEAIELIAPLAAERKIAISAAPCDEAACVLADRQRLKQVLLNVLSNAVKYNRDGGRVDVRLERAGDDRLRLTVSDTGQGVGAEQLERLFVPFERLGADAGPVEGTGLGLTLAKGLTEAMGGRIGFDSRPGEGSTFWIELEESENPPHFEKEIARPVEAATANGAKGYVGSVLYVEDNLSNLRLVERIFDRFPHVELVAAMQGRLALELAREHRPDLILLDLHLPDLDGEQVLAELREEKATAAIPVIILSADATPGRIKRLFEVGVEDYLSKPIDVKHLIDLVGRHVPEPVPVALGSGGNGRPRSGIL